MALFRNKPLPGSVPALFLHIQKTAGTSLLHRARQFYEESIVTHGGCWGKSADQLRHIRFISGHIGYNFAQPLMQGRYTFTFLRDPVERILSMYYFCRSRDPKEFDIYDMAHKLDLREFLEAGQCDPCVRKNIWNNQVWQLAHGYAHLDERSISDFGEDELLRLAKEHLGKFSHVGFTETFIADSRRISRSLGLPLTKEMPTLNSTPGRTNAAQQPPDVRCLLERLTELDREFYEYARHHFGLTGLTNWWRW